MVSPLARLTLKHAVAEQAVWKSFESRILAMASAHGLLTRESWEGADLHAVIAESLQAHGGSVSSGFGSILIEQAFAPHGSDVARVQYLPGGIAFEARIALPNKPLGLLS